MLGALTAKADEAFDPNMFSSEAESDAKAFNIEPPKPEDVIGIKGRLKPKTVSQQAQAPKTATPLPMDDEDLDFPEEITDDEMNEGEAAIAPRILPSTPPAATNTPATQTRQPNNSQGLVDAISDKNTVGVLPLPNVENTWIGKIKEKASELSVTGDGTDKPGNSDENMRELMEISQQKNKRSNASIFDISGLMLRMSLAQVDKTMQIRGFKKTNEKLEIPNFIKWRNEEKCRASGVVGFERLANCVIRIAKENGHQYADTVKYAKYDSEEEIEVKLTSNFTKNKVYRIKYKSMSPKITGNSAKSLYLRNVKIYDFWKRVNQKYGVPDNKDEVIWGLGGNKPYLQAASGFLMLEDPMLRELDYTRMSREDQRYMNTDLYNF